MSNGAQLASGLARYRTVRELGSRSPRSCAAFREPNELVVIHTYARATEAKAKASGEAFVASDGQVSLGSEAMGLLLRDARCLAKNWHPNIARVRHVDLIGEDLTIATELLDGATLADLSGVAAANRGRDGERAASDEPLLPLPVIVRVLVDVLAGLHGLHALRDGKNLPLGTIHGAVCPTNVVVGKDGVARLVSALRTRPVRVGASSEAVGYSAPEALDIDGTSDPRADVHAVGVILWEALTGRRLYDETDPMRVLARQRQEDIEPPRCAADSAFARLPEIAMRALAFDPALRFKTAGEMSAALRTAAGSHIATGSVVAACVVELAGERIRARRAELDPTGSAARLSSDRLQRVVVATENAASAVTAPPPPAGAQAMTPAPAVNKPKVPPRKPAAIPEQALAPVIVAPDSRPVIIAEQAAPQPATMPTAHAITPPPAVSASAVTRPPAVSASAVTLPPAASASAVTRPPRLGTSPDLSASADLTGTSERTAPTDLGASPDVSPPEPSDPTEVGAPPALADATDVAAPAATAASPTEVTFAPIVEPTRHKATLSTRPLEMPARRRTAVLVMIAWAIALVLVLAGISVRTIVARRTHPPTPAAGPAVPTTEVRSSTVLEPAASDEPTAEPAPSDEVTAKASAPAEANGGASAEVKATAEPTPLATAEPTPLASASTEPTARAEGAAAATNATPKHTAPAPARAGEPTKPGTQGPPRSKKSTYEPLGI